MVDRRFITVLQSWANGPLKAEPKVDDMSRQQTALAVNCRLL